MIPGLAEWLAGVEPAGAPELEAALAERLDARAVRLESGETLWRGRVHRLRFVSERTPPESLVVKRLPLDRSLREQRAVRRWLPAVGLEERGPPLIAVAVARSADAAWHVYEDVGDGTLARHASQPGEARRARIGAAVALAATVHLRFAGHPLLAEGRLHGIHLGARFFADAVGDAARALAALRRRTQLPAAQRPLVERLLGRLRGLGAGAAARARSWAELGWPETLLHGDLWPSNFMWARGAHAERVRLIDWDHAGLGTGLYDLSTLLRQFPAAERPWILDAYRGHVAAAGWRWPGPELLEHLAESCELGRYASTLLWRALYLLEQPGAAPEWAWEELREIERWFVERTPLLASEDAAPAPDAQPAPRVAS